MASVKIFSAVLFGVAGLLALRLWVAEPMTVASDSMEPTVMRGSIVILAPGALPTDPRTGQMVVFRSPENGKLTLKRVAGKAGQTLAIKDGVVYVDGAALHERYVNPRQTDGTFYHEVTVPAAHLFVLGDNRAYSIDSRDYGFVPLTAVAGTVLWPG